MVEDSNTLNKAKLKEVINKYLSTWHKLQLFRNAKDYEYTYAILFNLSGELQLVKSKDNFFSQSFIRGFLSQEELEEYLIKYYGFSLSQ
jgi:hypothetical protein